ncbi:unnamed protein product [Amoebophrya sp. A25]|nr:unnamed protein product [Amoebophrya sp. A25]|eukprot:GSA25T00009471001.1
MVPLLYSCSASCARLLLFVFYLPLVASALASALAADDVLSTYLPEKDAIVLTKWSLVSKSFAELGAKAREVAWARDDLARLQHDILDQDRLRKEAEDALQRENDELELEVSKWEKRMRGGAAQSSSTSSTTGEDHRQRVPQVGDPEPQQEVSVETPNNINGGNNGGQELGTLDVALAEEEARISKLLRAKQETDAKNAEEVAAAKGKVQDLHTRWVAEKAKWNQMKGTIEPQRTQRDERDKSVAVPNGSAQVVVKAVSFIELQQAGTKRMAAPSKPETKQKKLGTATSVMLSSNSKMREKFERIQAVLQQRILEAKAQKPACVSPCEAVVKKATELTEALHKANCIVDDDVAGVSL